MPLFPGVASPPHLRWSWEGWPGSCDEDSAHAAGQEGACSLWD